MFKQTDRHSGWIGEIVAAHTLAHVVHSVKTQSYVCFTNVYGYECDNECDADSLSLLIQSYIQTYILFARVCIIYNYFFAFLA
jgi:hypothetical protein